MEEGRKSASEPSPVPPPCRMQSPARDLYHIPDVKSRKPSRTNFLSAHLFKNKKRPNSAQAPQLPHPSQVQQVQQEGLQQIKGDEDESEGQLDETDEEDEDGDSFSHSNTRPHPAAAAAAPQHKMEHRSDFIMRRFLPAAKAMADESFTPSGSSSPAFSPRVLVSTSAPTIAKKMVASPLRAPPAVASVEKIQSWQYKFSGNSSIASKPSSHRDFFNATKACGFFLSFGLLKKHGPSSRLRRVSRSENNRFASNDFVVKEVESEAEASSEEEGNLQSIYSPRVRKLDASPSPDAFYDCQVSFPKRKPQFERSSCYSKSPLSPKPHPVNETKGFLGLLMRGTAIYRGGETPASTPSDDDAADWRADSLRKKRSQLSVAVKSVASSRVGTAGNEDAEVDAGAETLRSAMYRCDMEEGEGERRQASAVESNDWASAARLSPLLVPPRSPTQSWLCKALPSPVTLQGSSKWEAAVKSRQLRAPAHLRHAEVCQQLHQQDELTPVFLPPRQMRSQHTGTETRSVNGK